jgi:surfactin synthase thioesterase subunit
LKRDESKVPRYYPEYRAAIEVVAVVGEEFCDAIRDYRKALHKYDLAAEKLKLRKQSESVYRQRQSDFQAKMRQVRATKMHQRVDGLLALKMKIIKELADFRIMYQYHYLQIPEYDLNIGMDLAAFHDVCNSFLLAQA